MISLDHRTLLLPLLGLFFVVTITCNTVATAFVVGLDSSSSSSKTQLRRSLQSSFSSSKTTTRSPSSPSSLTTTSSSTSLHYTSATTTAKGNAYDLAIIGAGVVGATAAIAAAQAPFSKKVVLIDAPTASGKLMGKDGEEDLSLGGPTGLFSKALRDTSKRIQVNSLRGMGLRDDSVWNEIINNCIDLAQSNSEDIQRQLDMAGVTYKRGYCSFSDDGNPYSLSITMQDFSVQTVMSDQVLLCTGSQPFRPSGIPFDGKRIFDSDSINGISFLPKSIAITGSGIIAVEYAKIFRNLGADVTMIIRDTSPRTALQKIGLDKDVAALLVADLLQSGIKIERSAQVQTFEVPPALVRAPMKLTIVEAKTKQFKTELKCDAYLAAVGRKPNSAGLNLQRAGIQVDAYGGVVVDSTLKTTATAANVYAAGDVLGRPFLASIGVAQGLAAVNNMFRLQKVKVEEDETDDTDDADDDDDKVKDLVNLALKKLECDADDPSCVQNGYAASGTQLNPAALAANPFAFPTGVWSSPEAAYYGLTMQQAKEMGIDNADEGIALYCECLRGRVFSPNGLLKLVFQQPAGRILGVHICGDDACELIHYGMECIKGKRTIAELSQEMFSAVTYHEMYRIAAQAGLDQVGARKRRAAAGAALAKKQRQQRLRTE